jgi:hypothetical protein
MLKHGKWKEKGHLDRLGKTRREQALHGGVLPEELSDPFNPILDRISTQVEVLATMWCLDHYVPLLHHGDGGYPWVLSPYERLVIHGRQELRRIASALSVEIPSEMLEKLDEPSSSVKDQLHQDSQKQLSKWRRRLEPHQVDKILRIVDEVGLSKFYNSDLEPNYEALNTCQRPQYMW